MHIYKLISALVMFLGLTPSPAFSNDFADSFNKASSTHVGQFGALMTSRGISHKANKDNKIVTFDKIDKIMKLYRHDSTLIFYHHDNTSLKIWAFNTRGVAFEEVQISKQELNKKIEGYRKAIGSTGYQLNRSAKLRGIKVVPNSSDHDDVSMEEISALLLPKDIEIITNLKPNILIVPSQNIGSVPFNSLVFPTYKKPLSDMVSITLLPSLFDVEKNRSGRYRGKKLKALIVGNPKFAIDEEWDFPQLPGAENESKAISTMFDSDLYIGENATKANVLSKIHSADIIYLATHGIASATSPLDNSFLVLADGQRLTAKEIQNLYLRADLVVLSACQTALGAVDDAGIIGLARAFKIAGANEVVVSLWNVDDLITEKLMVNFMRNYTSSSTVDASSSLSRSMRQIKETYPEPLHWAPFVVINGKGSIKE